MSASGVQTASEVDPQEMLAQAFRRAIASVAGPEHADLDPAIRPSQRADHGDFQANFAMSLAKRLGTNPRDLATRVVEATDLDALAEPLEVAGPGFINIRLRGAALAALLRSMDTAALGVAPSDDPHPIAIDLCGVNVAKQMHVGHLRSTIIGDALARVFERLGRTVHRENHLGDWGLPIAMVLHQLRSAGTDLDTLQLDELDRAYRDAQLTTRRDTAGLERALALGAGPHRIAELEEQNVGAAEALDAAKQALVQLQRGNPSLRADWQKLIDCTLGALYVSLDLMGVKLGAEHNRGESMYREHLPEVVDAFVRADIAREDQGALVVPFEDRERPMLIRKSDGGFLYATTDLAALRFRVHELGANRVIYIVDARQREHFRDIFDAVRLIGWDHTTDGDAVTLDHVPFGAVLGPDRKPLKTRSGENITLESLLREAIQRGIAEVRDRATNADAPTHGLSDERLGEIGRAVGIGAIKYADLSNDLVRDYEFDFDRLISFEGNTGPYIQYAHARVCSIFRRAEIDPATLTDVPLLIEAPEEKQLALRLLLYPSVIRDVARSLEPHRLCNYLYELANAYSTFYQHCPVLRADDADVGRSRLHLSDLVRRVLADGLGLLGIEAPDRM
jgi:arginyl-tRNA synthetase